MSTLNLTTPQIQAVAELLLGAAHADGEYDGHEAEVIGDVLRGLGPEEDLPPEVSGHLARFDIEGFQIEEACSRLSMIRDDDKLGVLALIHEVTDADGVHDLAESEYIHQVAEALGVDEDEVRDHTIELIEVAGPPPIPENH